MSLPSREVLDDIRDLIFEITGFQETDENFAICERYCLSHVVHHSYPFINRTSVKTLVSSYVSRFYSHGYFKVSQELDYQVQSFLSNETLFEKNPQYDIQWCLLSLLTSLSSHLTSIKKLPELLPIDIEENKSEDFDWKEYLMNELPLQVTHSSNSDSEELSWDDEEEEEANDKNEENEKEALNLDSAMEMMCHDKKNLEIIFDNIEVFSTESSSEIRKQKIEEFLKSKKSKRDLDVDVQFRGNITEKFDRLMDQVGIIRKAQPVSELEMMENILFQFQTGEKIFLRKGLVNPALSSLTQVTLCNYLESLQPYFKIIRCFKDFDCEISEAKYPEKWLEKRFSPKDAGQTSMGVIGVANQRKTISNVLFIYNVMLRKALEPFQQELTNIVENLGNYTLLQMEQKLKPYYDDLSSLFDVHNSATKNWEKDCNWVSSARMLSVLYTAIMDATSTRMSFLFLNFFLHCFQVYLDLIDAWISFVDLIDPRDEFIVAKSACSSLGKVKNKSIEYEIRPYKTQIEEFEVKKLGILDFIAEKMIHVGQSLEVLRRLNRFVAEDIETPKETSYHLLVKAIDEKIRSLGVVKSAATQTKAPEKQRTIFTMKNVNLRLERDSGGGDCPEVRSLLHVIKEDEEKEKEGKKTELEQANRTEECYNNCEELINSVVRNPFFKMSFDSIGMKQVQKQLEAAKARQKQESGDGALMIIQKPDENKIGIYPFHKIITEAFPPILENRVSGACALVKSIILKECNLPMHLSLLRSILLFNDSYLIQPFTLALFSQPVIWGSSYSLSLHLKECVRSLYKDHANALSVVLKKNTFTKCENILQVIDAITVNYEVEWPLTLIITPETLWKYNKIFRMALKLKWAHWALCGLHFQVEEEVEEEEDKGSKSVRHRHRLLRFWLLSALGRINNYFLAQMTPSDVNLNSCTDLKEMICAHAEFLEEIHHNCLLGEKSPEGRKLIFETLIPLCMDLLQEGCDRDEVKLSAIEKKFGSCHLLLSRLFYFLEK